MAAWLLLFAAPGAQGDYDRGVQAYERGDYAAAYGALLSVAERGHALAQYNLGNMLLLGTGVPTNEAQATAWFRRAAEQGVVPAQYELGRSYALGRGVRVDPLQAYVWFSVAAAQGDRKSRHNQKVVGKRLSATELDRGDELAEDYYYRYARQP